ncbi:IclR family transcriptional regulator [Pseudomonas gingeri NCPPB 3146 = LMG 5327]|uniref:HTH-type transcriptional repressor AllR n=2 Tax=Pseudomonas gingeri TaxID=117681 RepID=A0A7Y7Y4S6_9PSED|nr:MULTISPECIES: IclR family transcriptional regulator [Pseudomonas]NVZ28039.1 IclR family transcriptional regulator [Pseudomonas gingeri]NWA05999.1 IclR family transcriptional regulator [Pseudomonas gingeri]NWC17868.1 IclR family transcriptional regulator [Pseudomonas gingeri]NWE73532.1 IclR family transcriptional regulator [Pseudomonas gingeri]PNQ90634.1 IclR family transcriptional regulator [Pseudomonas gingeri NCPPB 3146 = LMG 5327]
MTDTHNPAVSPASTESVESTAEAKGSSLERMLKVLDLFTEHQPVWTVDDLGTAMGFTRSTIYRYVRELAEVDLLFQVEAGRYALGARIITWDRQLRVSDPLVRAANQLESQFPQWSPSQVWLTCRLFKDQVVCVHQSGSIASEVSYTRGTPRPLFLGATSKAILANLGSRQHNRLYLEKHEEVRLSHLGQNWEEFRRSMQRLRKKGYVVSRAEVDSGICGIAAPIFDSDGKAIGSISCVRPDSECDAARDDEYGQQIVQLAQQLSQLMQAFSGRPRPLD